MSDGIRVPLESAQLRANMVVALLEESCERIVVAGSVRRCKPLVGDVEIVAMPKFEGALNLLHHRLDMLVQMGEIEKVRVLVGARHQFRWGEQYRAFKYAGMKFDLFVADEANWGYQTWLRTGPGDANQHVMQVMKYQRAPYRAEGGYWWARGQKIRVPDEATMFRLLGIDGVIEPPRRTLELYQQALATPRWADLATLDYDDLPVQAALF